ncbi:DNA polymerase III subunit delta' [Ramlibacter sp. AN1015]|uniref:DNA polymerase III subunit delta' n=1 Tax=Ramlibacter sp. AN1015 TaxID=3133428 RepID=UPI0030BC069C
MAVSAAPWIASQLRQLLVQPGHALLLQGPSGLGQYELALGLARGWLCEQPTADGGCAACPSCHAIAVRTHADLCLLMPETGMLELGWPLGEKAQQEIDDKKRKPSREIRVEALRDAVEFSQRTSARGRGKVVVVYPAERMNAIAANALLKTLEEPAGDTRFVLASDAAHQLLPTIRSRCIGHTMAWPDEAQALSWLAAEGLAAADAAVLLRAAGGRPDDAMRAARAGREARQWSQLPRALARGDVQALAGLSPAEAVNALQKVCHDLLAAATGARPRFFAPSELPAPPPVAELSAWWRELISAARTAEHPFNPGLMLEALVSRARTALHLPGRHP